MLLLQNSSLPSDVLYFLYQTGLLEEESTSHSLSLSPVSGTGPSSQEVLSQYLMNGGRKKETKEVVHGTGRSRGTVLHREHISTIGPNTYGLDSTLVLLQRWHPILISPQSTSFQVLQNQEVLTNGNRWLFSHKLLFDAGEIGNRGQRSKWFLSPPTEMPALFAVFPKQRKVEPFLRLKSRAYGTGREGSRLDPLLSNKQK